MKKGTYLALSIYKVGNASIKLFLFLAIAFKHILNRYKYFQLTWSACLFENYFELLSVAVANLPKLS